MSEEQAPRTLRELPIQCKYDELVDPATLTPHPENWNEHPPQQVAVFKEILEYQGIRRNIKVSRRSGYVVTGHGLLKTLLEMGVKAPVEYQDYQSEQQELADLTADNQLSKLAVTNVKTLQTVVGKLDTGDIDLQVLGMPLAQVERLMVDVKTAPLSLDMPDGSSEGSPDPSPEEVRDDGTPPPSQPAPSSHVRQVQLFFNEESLREFHSLVQYAQQKYGVDNLTDAVMEALRNVHSEADSSDASATEEPVEHAAGAEAEG